MEKDRQKIGIGTRVGKLTVVGKTGETKNNYVVWRCVCDCGGEITADTRHLQRGTLTDCGCSTNVKAGMLDLTGMRFGMLVCVDPSPLKDRSGKTQWNCRCDCGNTCLAAVPQLRSGYKKSCGCLSHPPLKDYVGKRFGQLIVTEYAGKTAGLHRWKCICDCGNETVVGQTMLQNGSTKSCGCLQQKQIVNNLKLVEGTSVTRLIARMNRPPISTNRSGYNGVHQQKTSGKWIAQITFKGKTYHLGSFTNIEDAVKARKRGEEMYENFIDWYYDEYQKKDKRLPDETIVVVPAAAALSEQIMRVEASR